jgi:hypothetical protein
MRTDLTLGEFLTVDPSIRSAGVAAFRAGQLHAAGVVKMDTEGSDAARCLEMASSIVRWAMRQEIKPRVLVLEWPQIYRAAKSKGDPNDLPGLAGVGMAVAGILAMGVAQLNLTLEVVSYTPAEWAGQLPKSVRVSGFLASPRTRRIKSRLSEAEIETVATISSHDAFDAIGLGLHALGRLEPVRNFHGAE